jgi:hypothetical protein
MTDVFGNIEKLERDLWEAADNLRANSRLTSSDYFMRVPGVIFLRPAAMQSAFLYTARRLSQQTKGRHDDIHFRSQSKVLELVAGRNYSLPAATVPHLREGNDSMKRIVGLLLQFAFFFGSVLPVMAHHSFAAEFDDKKPVKLEGAVVRFEFMNPHSWIFLDVMGPDGKVVQWAVETGSTNALFRRGWLKDSLRAGDHITVDAFRAKDGSNTANASTVKLPDGRQLSGASSRDGQ